MCNEYNNWVGALGIDDSPKPCWERGRWSGGVVVAGVWWWLVLFVSFTLPLLCLHYRVTEKWLKVNCKRRGGTCMIDVGVGVGRLFQALKKKMSSKRLGWFSISSNRWQFLLFNVFQSVLSTSGCSKRKRFHGSGSARWLEMSSVISSGSGVGSPSVDGNLNIQESKKFRSSS